MNQSKLASIFKNFTKSKGEILVAAKSFYFGVGGGVKQFEKVLDQHCLKYQTVDKHKDGVGREILKVTLWH